MMIEEECTINKKASDNDTWLSPYVGYPAILFTCAGKTELVKILKLDENYYNVSDEYTSNNGWNYKIEDVLDGLMIHSIEESNGNNI